MYVTHTLSTKPLHLYRLCSWGWTCLRYCVSVMLWCAVSKHLKLNRRLRQNCALLELCWEIWRYNLLILYIISLIASYLFLMNARRCGHSQFGKQLGQPMRWRRVAHGAITIPRVWGFTTVGFATRCIPEPQNPGDPVFFQTQNSGPSWPGFRFSFYICSFAVFCFMVRYRYMSYFTGVTPVSNTFHQLPSL